MKFLYAGIAIELLFAYLAPFLMYTDPDWLENAVSYVVDKSKLLHLEESKPVVNAPASMNDYLIKSLGKTGEVVAIVVGKLV